MPSGTLWIPVVDLSDRGTDAMMRYALLIAPLIFAVGDWFAVAHHRRRLEYVGKPATMIALLGCLILWMRGAHDSWQAPWFLLGVALSLVGDVFLMLRRKDLFLAGLVAFLLAHICYTAGFNPSLPPLPSLLLLLPIAAAGASVLRSIVRGLRQRDAANMLLPVGIYAFVISLMLFSAWATVFRPTWGVARSGFAVLGGSLFFMSDILLAWDRFVKPVPQARLWVHLTYHVGQMALAASILLPVGVS